MRGRLVTVLMVLVLAGSALSIVLAVTRPDADAAGPPATSGGAYEPADLVGPAGDAVAAAVAGVPVLLTYDHRDLRAAVRASTRLTTARFAEVFGRTFERDSRPFALKRKAVTDAVVRGAGVVRTRGESAVTCLVYVDQRLVSGTPVDRGDPPLVLVRGRLLVDMVRRDDVWKIDGVRPL